MCIRDRSEVVFIDSAVKDPQKIIDSLPQDAEVVFLHPGQDGIQEITNYLHDKSNIDTIRIISEGNYRQIMLGSDVITSDNIAQYKEAIASWQGHLSQGADILFYGCDIAKDSGGQSILNDISHWTGADVAASTNATGFQGDWNLEYSRGLIQAHSITVSDYNHNLITYTVTAITDNGSGAAGTLSKAINDSNATPLVDDTIAFNLTSGSTVTISAALPIITDTVTIDGTNTGSGGGNVTVQVTTPGGSTFRVFNINASGETVNISNMTIKGGDVTSLYYNVGGGIYLTAGTLNLTSDTISGSKAGNGGGIAIDAGTVNITSSTISSNTATNVGGGIYNVGTLTINSSTISSNNGIGPVSYTHLTLPTILRV